VTPDAGRRKALHRALFATGRSVEFANDLDELLAAHSAETLGGSLVILDATARDRMKGLGDRLGNLDGAKLVALGDDLGQAQSLDLLKICDHLLGSAEGAPLDEDEVFVTSMKLQREDIFGLEKYLAWGAVVRELEVSSYDDKRVAVNAISEYAREAGARRQTVARIETVADELLMNALYDAPSLKHGSRETLQERAKPGAGPVTDQPVLVRYACDGGQFAISVRDAFGELKKSAIVAHLERARQLRGAPRDDARTGAGLGLYFVLNSVTRFVANVVPGQATEVIALFDLRGSGRDQPSAARSVSIFTRRTDPS
jgi:hypothetical protein